MFDDINHLIIGVNWQCSPRRHRLLHCLIHMFRSIHINISKYMYDIIYISIYYLFPAFSGEQEFFALCRYGYFAVHNRIYMIDKKVWR
jgi:hypothetical protein